MNDTKDQKAGTPSRHKKPQVEPEQRAAPVPRSGSGRWLLVFGLLLLIGVGSGLYAGYRYWLQIQADLQQLNGVVEQAAREQGRLQARVDSADQAFVEQQRQYEQQQQTLEQQRQTLVQERQKLRLQEEAVQHVLETAERAGAISDKDWMLAEAEYLMRLAQQRLLLAEDSVGAGAALRSADERLRATGNPRWAEVREVLAGEVSALAAVPEPDLEQLAASLQELVRDSAGLPLLANRDAVAAGETAAGSESSQASDQPSLRSLPDDIWSGFQSLMAVRHHERAPGAHVPSRELYLHENLRLQLEAARVALARRNAALYRASLSAALAWLDEFAEPGAPLSAGFRQRLQALAAVDIRPPLPDISASLRMLERRLAEQRAEDA